MKYSKHGSESIFGGMAVAKLLTLNAARVYGFDLDALQPLADEHCPTRAEMATPIAYADIPEEAKGCSGMNPLNQVQPLAA